MQFFKRKNYNPKIFYCKIKRARINMNISKQKYIHIHNMSAGLIHFTNARSLIHDISNSKRRKSTKKLHQYASSITRSKRKIYIMLCINFKKYLQSYVIAADRNGNKKHEPMASQEEKRAKYSLHYKLWNDKLINARWWIIDVQIICLQIRQYQKLQKDQPYPLDASNLKSTNVSRQSILLFQMASDIDLNRNSKYSPCPYKCKQQ